MADDEASKQKWRLRMERDVYAVLMSFKDGATPRQLENRMDETLGYSYNGEHYKAGVHDTAQLLREHEQIRQLSDGKFKIISTDDVADLVALISKQKDNKKKKRGGATKMHRPVTSNGYYRNGLRASPKGFGGNTSFTAHSRPATATSFSRPTTSNMNSLRQPFPNIKSNGQRLCAPSMTLLSSPRHEQNVSMKEKVTPAKVASKTCQVPSIKEFSENTKKILMKQYPRAVHLSELTDLYSQEEGFIVDPLQVFSKSWKMLAMTTFKDWLDLKESQVIMKEDVVKRNTASAATKRISEGQNRSENPYPSLQGFRYAPPKSPTDLIVQKLKCLTMGARQVLTSPANSARFSKNKKPLLQLSFNQEEHDRAKDDQKFRTTKNPENVAQREEARDVVDDQIYDSRNMANLRNVLKPAPMMEKIWTALEATPNLKLRNTRQTAALTRQESLKKAKMPNSTAGPSHTFKHQTVSISQKQKPEAKSAMFGGRAAPVAEQPPRSRSIRVSTPSNLLIGKALAAVKKQDDVNPVPRRVDGFSRSTQKATTTVVNEPSESVPSESIANSNIWNEPACYSLSRAGSLSGRKPALLPPMSKGAGMGNLPRREVAYQPSEHSSRSSSATRSTAFDEALRSGLPDSDKEMW